ncbi:serine hydrolase domain-containing protein [Nafulsella turpanensis]|uniref:serine hydrolase domain-containing protein n=1 Tax=Nafulsella turpanensis TaxID=1265690 RepID=UPI0009D9FF20|nr:serine hydrolase domain-containing protein [Nafulsella turpanensis]
MVFKVQFLILRCIAASVLCLLLYSCGESSSRSVKERAISSLEVKEKERQKMPVPPSFTPEKRQELADKLDSAFTYLHEKRGFNGTVLVSKYDRVIYKGAFGYEDFPSKDTLTTESVFQLASVSKQFTAMAIMILKEQGKLSYDDSVQQYIPDFPYEGITIRQLLNHRAGLSEYTYFSDALWPDRDIPITNDDVLGLMKEHQPQPYYQPNTHYDYSNTGYFLLASIVRRASGMPFAVFLQEYIFEPADMEDTYTFSDSLLTQTEKLAFGHTSRNRRRRPDYLDFVLGDKGVFSTVEDLYKWDQALYGEKLVTQETLKEAFTGSRTRKNITEDYGFGWRIKPIESGDTVVYHAGWWHGYNSYLWRNPKDHSALIMLSNVTNGILGYMDEVEQLLYPEEPLEVSGENKTAEETIGAQPQ